MRYFEIFLLCFLIHQTFTLPKRADCQIHYFFAPVCRFYDVTFKDNCYPSTITNCVLLRVSTDEFHCPRFVCENSDEEEQLPKLPTNPTDHHQAEIEPSLPVVEKAESCSTKTLTKTVTNRVTKTIVSSVQNFVTQTDTIREFVTKTETIRDILTKTNTVKDFVIKTETIRETIEPSHILLTKTVILPTTVTEFKTVIETKVEPSILPTTVVSDTYVEKTESPTVPLLQLPFNSNIEDSDDKVKMSSSFDCGSKVCYKHQELLETCVVYLPTPVNNCSIPCNLSSCDKKYTEVDMCDIWECFEKEPDWTPIVPSETSSDLPWFCQSIGFFISLSVNLLVVVLCLTCLIICCKKRQNMRRRLIEEESISNTPILRPQSRTSDVSHRSGFLRVDLHAPNENILQNEANLNLELDPGNNPQAGRPSTTPSSLGWFRLPSKLFARQRASAETTTVAAEESKPVSLNPFSITDEDEKSESETDTIEMTPLIDVPKVYQDEIVESSFMQTKYGSTDTKQFGKTLEKELQKAEKLMGISRNEQKAEATTGATALA